MGTQKDDINDFFSLNGYGPQASLVLSTFNQKDVDFIRKNKKLIKDFDFRKSMINIYFNYCYLYVNDVQKAFGIEIKDDKILTDALNYIASSTDISLNIKKKDLIETTIEIEWNFIRYSKNEKEIGEKITNYFCAEIKELEIKSVFYSKEEAKMKMGKSVRKWLLKKIEIGNFKQKIFDELPELILENLEVDHKYTK